MNKEEMTILLYALALYKNQMADFLKDPEEDHDYLRRTIENADSLERKIVAKCRTAHEID